MAWSGGGDRGEAAGQRGVVAGFAPSLPSLPPFLLASPDRRNPGSTPSSSPGSRKTFGPKRKPPASPSPLSTQPSTASGPTRSSRPRAAGTKADHAKDPAPGRIRLSRQVFAEKTIGAVTKGGRTRAGSLSKTLAAWKSARRAVRHHARHLGPRIRVRRAKMPYDASKFSARRLGCPPARTCFARNSSPACRWWRRASCRAPPCAPPGPGRWASRNSCRPPSSSTPPMAMARAAPTSGTANRHRRLDRQLPRRLWLAEGPRLGI